MIRRLRPRQTTRTLTKTEALRTLDSTTDAALKELMWEHGPEAVTQVQRLLETSDPIQIKDFLERNRQYVERKTQDELATENVGEKVAENIRKTFRRPQ